MGTCIAIVSNRAFLKRALRTILELRIFGRYRGDVALVIGDDLVNDFAKIRKTFLDIKVYYFPDIDRTLENSLIQNARGNSGTEISKVFQYHKLHLFSLCFKRWDQLLCLDAGMRIFRPLKPIFELDVAGSLIAHSDVFPKSSGSLFSQFNLIDFPDTKEKIDTLNIATDDYFQSGFMYFDTNLIEANTKDILLNLMRAFPNSKTNDQGILNLWALKTGIWKKLPTSRFGNHYIYDYWERESRSPREYIMLKYPCNLTLLRRIIRRALFESYWTLQRLVWTLRPNQSK